MLAILAKQLLKNFEGIDADVFVFGSWARGLQKQSSDMDVGFYSDQKISPSFLVELKDQLENLPLPSVDLIDFSRVDENFKSLALKHVIVWKRKKTKSLFEFKN